MNRTQTRSQALVLAGHGSQHHPESAAPIHAHADRIRSTYGFDEVRAAFFKEEPSLYGVAATLSSEVAYVVPVLTSEGYFADEVFPRELGVDGSVVGGSEEDDFGLSSEQAGSADSPGDADADPPGDAEIHYTEPVGTHEAMIDVICARIESAVEGPTGTVGVALVGHGTERNERSARATRRHAGRLRERGQYAEVVALFLDEEPFVGDLYGYLDADEIVVVPLFVADGYHTTRDVPEAIRHPGIGEVATIEGRRVHYTGAVGTEPSLADVIVGRAIEAGAEPCPRSASDASIARAGTSTARADEAFFGWIDASATGRVWGELSIRRFGAGYELRHRDDADLGRGELDAIVDPAALHEHVRHDDRGHYRPLSGARTLPTDWVLADVDPDDLVRAVRSVYPASIANWHRNRTGDLDVTHFRETAARQTGIYADVGELAGTEFEAATAAVCGDCVRRRRWEADDEGNAIGAVEAAEAIDTPGNEGEIPCREACPFFLSAARAFLDEEGDSGTATAVPDPDVPPGALSEPGNRYRVRYARALADDGSGDGEPVPLSPPVGGDW